MESYQVILNPIESHSAAFVIGVMKDKWDFRSGASDLIDACPKHRGFTRCELFPQISRRPNCCPL